MGIVRGSIRNPPKGFSGSMMDPLGSDTGFLKRFDNGSRKGRCKGYMASTFWAKETGLGLAFGV